MASIECNEITQVGNELLLAFQDCNKIKNSDLRKLTELVLAVSDCASGGASYNTIVNEVHTPLTDELVTYPVDTFHSISVIVIDGNIKQTVGVTTVTYPKGTSLNTTVTTLNQTPYEFTVTAGSTVAVEYLIETL